VDFLGNGAQQGCAAEWLVRNFDPHPPDQNQGLKTSMLGNKSIFLEGHLMLLGVFMAFLYIYTMLISTYVSPA